MTERALPYHEPSIITILIQSSFILVLNWVGFILDKAIYCGLVGQILIGIAYGTPGGQILSQDFEYTITEIGYLGLILLVYEGGLAASAKSIRSNLFLSIGIAITGVSLPIAFSFSLLSITNATHLQAFAAGCALCSTSLGTTFSVLKTCGLTNSRLGTVLSSAAMLDDVVGLIMIQVISNLGTNKGSSFDSVTVIRPIFVSIAYTIVVPLALKYVVRPVIIWGKDKKQASFHNKSKEVLDKPNKKLVIHTLILISLCTSASYAGTSVLYAAYLAGVGISSYEESLPASPAVVSSSSKEDPPSKDNLSEKENPSEPSTVTPRNGEEDAQSESSENRSKIEIGRPQNVLQEQGLFNSKTTASDKQVDSNAQNAVSRQREVPPTGYDVYTRFYAVMVEHILKPFFFASIGFSIPISRMFQGHIIWRGVVYATLMAVGKLICGLWLVRLSVPITKLRIPSKTKGLGFGLPRPKSLYPAALLGSAMVARGEIGFLIAAIADSIGVFSAVSNGDVEELYLVVIWAIMLCTIIGPVTVGVLSRVLRQHQRDERAKADGKTDPLGIWGIVKN